MGEMNARNWNEEKGQNKSPLAAQTELIEESDKVNICSCCALA